MEKSKRQAAGEDWRAECGAYGVVRKFKTRVPVPRISGGQLVHTIFLLSLSLPQHMKGTEFEDRLKFENSTSSYF